MQNATYIQFPLSGCHLRKHACFLSFTKRFCVFQRKATPTALMNLLMSLNQVRDFVTYVAQ